MTKNNKKEISPEQKEAILCTLKELFERNMHRHQEIEWMNVQVRLEADPEKLWSLNEMERTGGEPDISTQCYLLFFKSH